MIELFKNFVFLFKKRISLLTSSYFMRIVLFTPIACSIGMTIIIVWLQSYLPNQIPLFYSRPWGEEQLTHPFSLLLLPGGCILWYILSLLLIHLQTYQYRVFAQLLLISQSVISIGTVYVLLQIVLLVT